MSLSVTPGVVININGTDIPLSPDSISSDGKTDTAFSLPHPVVLGTPGDLAAFLTANFGAGASVPNFDTLPSPLNDIASKLANLQVTVEDFQLRFPATKDASGAAINPPPNKTYSIGLAGAWPTDPIALGPLKIKGVFLKVAEDGK